MTRASDLVTAARQCESEDKCKARELYERAAQLGSMDAEYALGLVYERGSGGVSRDHSKAVILYRSAAEKGSADAQYRLGVMCDSSAEYTNAQFGLDATISSPTIETPPVSDVPAKSDEEALRWYSLAAKRNHSGAQRFLAIFHEQGRAGLVPNVAAAIQLYSAAAAAGDWEAGAALRRLKQPAPSYTALLPPFDPSKMLPYSQPWRSPDSETTVAGREESPARAPRRGCRCAIS